ncbi:MAG: hypothetical protein K2N42_00840 [Anaeroplasmataceae bacterium]|nr:hypothetical protein [Anaeroplasmataceae bacterium]
MVNSSAASSVVFSACTEASSDEIRYNACISFMFGAVLGGLSGGVNGIKFTNKEELNLALHMGINTIMSLGAYLGQTYYTDGSFDKVFIGGIALTLVGGASAGYLPRNPLLSGYYNYLAIQAAMGFDWGYYLWEKYPKY